MRVRPWAGFIADFPDDQVEEGRNIVLFGGRNVATALGEILTGLGCEVSPPEYAELHGWEFDLSYKGRRFWCQVTSFHPAFHLFFDDAAVTRGARARNAAIHAELAESLDRALRKDPRFHRLTWRAKQDGPPEPDEIATAAGRDEFDDAASSPIDRERRSRRRSWREWVWGCFLVGLALWMSVTTLFLLYDFLVIEPEKPDRGGLSALLFALALGLWGLWAAIGRLRD